MAPQSAGMCESVQDKDSKIPSVLIQLLNFNSEQDTIACLASLEKLAYANYEILVIDNGSQNASIKAIREAYPLIQIHTNPQNLGFAAGNNVGLRYAAIHNHKYTLLLNNDTVVDPDFLGTLVDVAETSSRVAMLGPTIYYYDLPNTIWSAGGRIDRLTGQTEMIGLGETDQDFAGSGPREVDFITGCALLVRMSACDQIGFLDPRFFLYYEEVEWCARASAAGYLIYHIPASKIWHKISPESRASSPLVHYYMTRNRLLFLKAARLGWQAWMHTLLFEYARTMLSWSLRPKWRSKKTLRNAMAGAILDYSMGRFGKAQHRFLSTS